MDGIGVRRSQKTEAHAASCRIDRLPRAAYAQSRDRAKISRSRTISSLRTVPALLMSLACCRGSDQPPSLDATVAFPPRDTIRFSLPASTHRCLDGRSILLQAMGPEGSGVLVRVHSRDSLGSGSYRVVIPGDTTAPTAVVAVRYL